MLYKVRAKFDLSKAKEFYQLLTGGSLKDQAPDGPEILKSMDRATIDSSSFVRWTESCYCPNPLQHERTTVYDIFFSEFQTEETKDHEEFEGESFIKHISNL